ncbi:hypothetical protein K493DRAFT_303706 [Basidiobolus meristosporus CBS 931.73]|uniref:Uncharacterized protein n=1 Tax=Basidiobolus meristosporus CBS 931.73 TaxID=1314790 RepID=A0A1Y1Y1I2_9FUNG|nr:hypothetical protein K493DRAFT_303706 [Basidiobolus meristosporus CBS 931.73]|eukprot:ORX91872.1 hypothetical protein K493DRAFT_303706 [Basidiobolus meristosporus CBS 931.73]
MLFLKLLLVLSALLLTIEAASRSHKDLVREYKKITLQNYNFFKESGKELEQIKGNAEEGQIRTYKVFRKTMQRLKDIFLTNRTLRRQWNKAKSVLLKRGSEEYEAMVDKDTDNLENLFDAYVEEYKVTFDEVKRSLHEELIQRKYYWDKRVPI